MKKRSFTSKNGFLISASVVALMSSGHAVAQTAQSGAAKAPDAIPEVVVTGSRIATRMGTKSPTPLTVISTEQLLKTTPTDLPDGLNKLPVFSGSTVPLRPGSGAGAIAENVLNLRDFGVQRTLVLLDGQRVTPSNTDGTVDIDTLPQMLMSRVDVVTGGASAVYGSDAVTGVVNFVLNKNFTGLKLDANTGISSYGDAGSYKVGAAGGFGLFGDRAHVLFSATHRETDPVSNLSRPYGPNDYILTGNGTTAAPYTAVVNGRSSTNAYGGLVTKCTGCTFTANTQYFATNGVLGPFAPGAATDTSGQASGGDGTFSQYSTAIVGTRNNEAFLRFSYDLTPKTTFYIEGTYATADATGAHFPVKLAPGTFYKNNPYLSPTVQAALGNNGTNANGAGAIPANTFQTSSYINDLGPGGYVGSETDNTYYSLNTGLDGEIGGYRWQLYYTHGDNNLNIKTFNNTNQQKLDAAEDAVAGPNGPVCYAATQAATAAEYANCVPLNAFGPTAITSAAFNYFNQTTSYTIRNILDNVGGNITGDLFNEWAGPVAFALSSEARWSDYIETSPFSSSAVVNCAGLRICTTGAALFPQALVNEAHDANNVWEGAGELSIPLLKDLPFIAQLDTDLAARYTDYSTSGAATTWKYGFSYKVNNTIRIRATSSRDIRAPTLNDLFQPATTSTSANYLDIHTNTTVTLEPTISRGNPDLKPEVGNTRTIGIVFTPSFASNFSASLDYYEIKMRNAIESLNGTSPVIQQLCNASNGTSVYCALSPRPFAFSNTSAANVPSVVYSETINAAFEEIQGYDVELNYHHAAPGGTISTRLLANYQPQSISRLYPGAPTDFYVVNSVNSASTGAVTPKTHITAFLTYQLHDMSINLEDHWLSAYNQTEFAGQAWATSPKVGAFNTVDLSVDKRFTVHGVDTTAYISVQNLFNTQPPLQPWGGSVGITYPVPYGDSIIGTYFTVGFHATL